MGHPVQLGNASTTYWQAGAASGDPVTGPYDALNRLPTVRWDSGLGTTTRSFYANSNLPTGYAITLPGAAGTRFNVYSSQNMTWQGSLLTGYTVTSNWEGGGTSYAAHYDLDGHLHDWSAAALGSLGSATQQFNETYAFSLENIQSVAATNNLGLTSTSSYKYDPTFRERVQSVSVASTNVADSFDYDRRGRGLITAHRTSSTQNPPQDAYEYDVDARLISISKLGSKVEDLSYGPDGQLVARQFTGGTDTARYYVGDFMTLVRRGTNGSTSVGYAHIYVGSTRIASVWSKSTSTATTTGTIYYHRNEQRSVVATTTAGGQVGISYRYLPSGALDKTIGSEADENASELGFTGGLRLSGGLIHLKARVYAPSLRRFLQPDSVDRRRYTYAHGDPLNFIDPTGHQEASDIDSGDPGRIRHAEDIPGITAQFSPQLPFLPLTPDPSPIPIQPVPPGPDTVGGFYNLPGVSSGRMGSQGIVGGLPARSVSRTNPTTVHQSSNIQWRSPCPACQLATHNSHIRVDDLAARIAIDRAMQDLVVGPLLLQLFADANVRTTLEIVDYDIGALYGGPPGTAGLTLAYSATQSIILINPDFIKLYEYRGFEKTVLHELGHVYDNAYQGGIGAGFNEVTAHGFELAVPEF